MLVQGLNVLLLIFNGDEYVPYMCARSVTLNVTTDFIETSVSGTGVWQTSLPTKNSFTVSMEGLVNLNNPGSFTIDELRQKQFSQEKLLGRCQITDNAGNLYTEEFSFYIASSSDTGTFDGMATFSMEGRGTGPLSKVPPSKMEKENSPFGTHDFVLTQTGYYILNET